MILEAGNDAVISKDQKNRIIPSGVPRKMSSIAFLALNRFEQDAQPTDGGLRSQDSGDLKKP